MPTAGYDKGFDTTFQIPTGGSGEIDPVAMAEWIANDAAKVGITHQAADNGMDQLPARLGVQECLRESG